MDVRDIKPGVTLYAGALPLKLSALFTSPDSNEIHALVGLGGDISPHGQDVFEGRKHSVPLGALVDLREIIASAGDLALLFAVVRFRSDVAAALADTTVNAAVTSDLARNVMVGVGLNNRPGMRVRKLSYSDRNWRSNWFGGRQVVKGFVTGDVTNPSIGKLATVQVERAALVRGKGKRDFAKPGDRGLPVLSASGALLGFVVGRDDEQTLVLSAEEMIRQLKLQFLTPIVRPGMDVPIRRRSRQKA